MKLLLENWREYIKEQEETNEIFGMGKKYIDLDTDHLDAIQQIPIAINHAVRGLEEEGYSQELYKEYLEKLIKDYEEEVDPMLSRLMVAKSQIDKSTRTIDPFVAKSVNHYLPDEVASWENDSDLIKQLIELILNMRNKILGAYKRHRNKVSNMPPYKPKPNMHDLENLMGKAKVREEVNEIFGMGKDTADIDSETLRKVFETQLDADYLNKLIRSVHSASSVIFDPKKRMNEYKRVLIMAIGVYEKAVDPLLSQMMVVKKQIENGTHKWPTDLESRGVGGIMSHKLSDPTEALEHALKVLYRARDQLLGLYAKHKQDAGLPPYNPPKSMHDLEKLMDTAKEG